VVIEPLIFWSAQPIFDIPYSFERNGYGSGDTTYNYLQLFWNIIFVAIFTFPLYYVIQKKNIVTHARYFFLLLLRIYLAIMMLVYGISKVFPSQFPPISLLRLSQPYGESSPMGLAWTFMQYSHAYAAFTGFAEIIGAILLLWRRTSTFGALILVGVMANVVMMNFCYDIPVKLSSLHLLIAAAIIMWNDRVRILDFVINRQSEPKEDTMYFADSKARKNFALVTTGFKVLVVGGILAIFSFTYFSSNAISKDILMGSYDVQNPVDGKFSNITFDYGRASIRMLDNSETMYSAEIDTTLKVINLRLRDKQEVAKSFKYSIGKNGLELMSDTTQIKLRKKTKEDFLLMKRGFRWINETPFNR
jgi:uncharacterized membrane protein YphA (DoxX/SURF4 family)